MTSLMWFRRDLRLRDNPALLRAAAADPVVPVFVLDARLTEPSGAPRVAFLLRCLRELDETLGGALVLRSGDPREVIARIAEESGASSVFGTADFGPYGRERDAAVAALLAERGVAFELVDSPYAVPPDAITKHDGTSYRMFTPFYRAWRERVPGPPAPLPAHLVPAGGIASEPFPPEPELSAALPAAGERGALARLDEALGRGDIDVYARDRDRPDRDRTSRLSPYLKFGCVHPRQVLDRLGKPTAHEALRRQLAWRDFYAHVVWHQPDSTRDSMQPFAVRMRVDEGRMSHQRFEAWAAGRTGYPIVDAGMRQLLGEAWVHNRVRMIAASFLVKDLHLDWRRGARLFMQRLVDGDLASNNHGWQWVAGTGTDAAPYHRIFNPVLQGKRFDPDGSYVRRWVPELADVEGAVVHEPWALARAIPGYPKRIVEHAEERQEALARYSAARSTPNAQEKD